MKYQDNRGKTCSTPGCDNTAGVKGLRMRCYENKKYKEI